MKKARGDNHNNPVKRLHVALLEVHKAHRESVAVLAQGIHNQACQAAGLRNALRNGTTPR